jgi:hypothetical protein
MSIGGSADRFTTPGCQPPRRPAGLCWPHRTARRCHDARHGTLEGAPDHRPSGGVRFRPRRRYRLRARHGGQGGRTSRGSGERCGPGTDDASAGQGGYEGRPPSRLVGRYGRTPPAARRVCDRCVVAGDRAPLEGRRGGTRGGEAGFGACRPVSGDRAPRAPRRQGTRQRRVDRATGRVLRSSVPSGGLGSGPRRATRDGPAQRLGGASDSTVRLLQQTPMLDRIVHPQEPHSIPLTRFGRSRCYPAKAAGWRVAGRRPPGSRSSSANEQQRNSRLCTKRALCTAEKSRPSQDFASSPPYG